MADKEAKEVQKWQDRISVSRKWRDQVSSENNWEKLLDQLDGKFDVVLGNTPVPPINEMFAYKDATLANLFYRDPYIAVNAKKDASIEASYILEAAVNYYWRELKIKEEIELQITDALFIGHAWNKVGVDVKTSGSGDQLKLEKDALFSNRVSWRDMFMNVGCQKPTKDNLWIAQRIYRPTDDIKKDYGKIAAKINGSAHPNVDEKYKKNILFKEDFNYSAIYEIWDARERKIYLICDEIMDGFLENPKPWPDYLDEFGYQFLSFHDIPDRPYPQSDVGPWEPQVKEKIKIFTQMLNHIKRWNRQLISKKGALPSSEWDKFEKGIDGSILHANTTGDIQASFKMIDFGALPPDIYMALDRIDAIIRKVSGMPEFAFGGSTRTQSRTEGELQMIKGGSDARTDRKLNRIERHCENIARQLIAHMKNQFFVPTLVKITGKEPPEIIKAFMDQGKFNPVTGMITFEADDIKGEFDVTVKTGSTLPLDKVSRDKVLDQVMQTGAQLAAVPTIPPFMAEVIKERLRDYEIKGLEVAFDQQLQQQDQSQQDEQAASDIQSQKVVAETAKRQAQAQQINVDTVIKGAQAVGKAADILPAEVSLTK
jgi:hypothetical protein